MPYGTGTYGSKVGRPKSKVTKKKKKKKKKLKLKRKGNGARTYQQIPGRDKPANPENPIYGN